MIESSVEISNLNSQLMVFVFDVSKEGITVTPMHAIVSQALKLAGDAK